MKPIESCGIGAGAALKPLSLELIHPAPPAAGVQLQSRAREILFRMLTRVGQCFLQPNTMVFGSKAKLQTLRLERRWCSIAIRRRVATILVT